MWREVTINGPWRVSFPPNSGAPLQATLDKLISWTECKDDRVRYFSGTATYEKDIEAPQQWVEKRTARSSSTTANERRIVLDLGRVKEMAEVSVNGEAVGGILWKPPFSVDITGLLRPGRNHIQVKVTNLWPNRMIGDLQSGVTKIYTWTDFRPFTKDSPLLESGLIGPVVLTSDDDSSGQSH